LDTALPYLYYFLRLIWSLQNFADAIPVRSNKDTFVRNNFALQIHEINLQTVSLPQVFVVNVGDINQLQLVGSSIEEANFSTFDNVSDIEGQPTAYASLPESLFVPGNDTVLRVHYAVFLNDVLFQLRSMSELAETYRGFETGSIIISARVGSGPPPENIADPGLQFFFQKNDDVSHLTLACVWSNVCCSLIHNLQYLTHLHICTGCTEWKQYNLCLLGF